MNYQNFNQSGGFPFQTETLDQMQTATDLFNKFGDLAGNFAIISGCVVTGDLVSDGAVFINGELLEFRGGNIGTDVIIVEIVTAQEFEDGNDKNVLFVRYATFGVGLVSFPWASFNRVQTLVALTTRMASLEQILLPLSSGDGWLLFNKPASEIPVGWAEVTEMRGRMPIGLDSAHVPFNTIGNFAGAKNIKLTENHIPEYDPANGDFNRLLKYTGGGTAVVVDNLQNPGEQQPFLEDSKIIKKFGKAIADQYAVDLLNPYRIVLYIKYVG
jgi:hypothetical protein